MVRRRLLDHGISCQPVALVDEALAEGGAAVGEGALGFGVLASSLGGLDADRVEAEIGEVVRRGAHVEDSDIPGEFETVGNQIARHHGREAEGVLVEVHSGMQTGRLFVRRPVVVGRLEHVE